MRSSAALAKNDLSGEGFVTLKSALSDTVGAAEATFRGAGGLRRLSSGLGALDDFSGGLYPGELIVVAGRQGVGKTSLAANIAFNVARAGPMSFGDPVAFFSLEMSSEQLATRIISMQTGIPSSRIKRGEITEAEFESLVASSQMMQKVPLFIDHSVGVSIAEVVARARRLKRQHGLALIVVDYLQLIRPPSQVEFDEGYDISTVSTELKSVAEDLNVPVLALSRLPRAVEQKDGRALASTEQEEFGAFVQDADIVMFLDAVRRPRDLSGNSQGSVDLIVARHRRGLGGIATLKFDASTMRFSGDSYSDVAVPAFPSEASTSRPRGQRWIGEVSAPIGFSESRAFLDRAVALTDEALAAPLSGDTASAFSTAELIGGEQTLGQSIRSSADLARAVQTGFPAAVLDYLRDAGLSGPEIETAVAPARTLARRRKDGRLTIDESAAVERIARILATADRVLGSREAALSWLRRPQATRFGGATPLSYLQSDIGARVVEEILLQVEYGLTA